MLIAGFSKKHPNQKLAGKVNIRLSYLLTKFIWALFFNYYNKV